MNPLVAAIVLVASLVLALGATRQAAVGRSVLLLAAMAIAADLPAVFNARREAAFLACWACVLANTAGVYLTSPRICVLLACTSGLALGGLVDASGQPWLAACTVLVALVAPLRRLAHRVPVALKVLSSWLTAVALLAAFLQFVPLTPGYEPDHLE